MLWFRVGAVVFIFLTFLLSLGIGVSCFIMCISPGSDRGMDTDPYYNGYLFYYVFIIITEICMVCATIFGFIVAFRVWKNNHQMDHTLRGLFTIWLAVLGLSTLFSFIFGILGLVRYREPQEEIVSLYEIFAKYSQDVKFVGAFERFQRENSCCGINGPEDWYLAQVKTGGSYGMGMGMGMEMAYMGVGSPSTGKCHLTPPTIPMGCGKKLMELIHYVLAIYCSLLILQTACAISTAAFGWYCFFYWIEKEVIIIPEDEVSNLIVIEPESSTTTMSSTKSASIPSTWSGTAYNANGSQLTYYSKPSSGSRNRYSSMNNPGTSTRRTLDSRHTHYSNGSGGSSSGYRGSRSYYPRHSRRHADVSNETQFSNFLGATPTIGGPHVEYHFPDRSRSEAQSMNHNHISSLSEYYYDNNQQHGSFPSEHTIYESRQNHRGEFSNYSYNYPYNDSQYHPTQSSFPPQNYGLHHGHYGRSVTPHEYNHYTEDDFSRRYSEEKSENIGYIGSSLHDDNLENYQPSYHHEHKPKIKHSFNHMLHKQEKALGGKVVAEMRVDHNRDPDPINSYIDTAKGKRGHREHHATIAVVKNKKAPKPKTIVGGPQDRHGQTGRLAEDIIDMSGGAAAVKSLIDDINLPVEHEPSLTHERGYVNKLHHAKRKKSQLAHPDADKPGHGPVHQLRNGKLSAPSIDGSQAQSLMDNVFHPKPKPPPSKHAIKPHDVQQKTHHHQHDEDQEHEHHHHHHHNHSNVSHQSNHSEQMNEHSHHHHHSRSRNINDHSHHQNHSRSHHNDHSHYPNHSGNHLHPDHRHDDHEYYSGRTFHHSHAHPRSQNGSLRTEVLFKNSNTNFD